MPRALTSVLFVLLFLHGLISERVFGASWALNGQADSRTNQLVFELMVCITVAGLLRSRSIRLPLGSTWFLLYATWALLSGLLTTDTLGDGFMYCRYSLYAFAFYTAVWNHAFPAKDLRRLTALVAGLGILQVVAAVVKILVMNDRTEWRVGTMMIAGGGLATVFPLLALAYAMACYFYVRRSFWILLLGLSFAVIGYASGKRAIYFLLPAAVVANVLLYSALERTGKVSVVLPRFLIHLGAAGILAVPALLYGIVHSDGIGFIAEGATASEIFDHALDYARGYENGRTAEGLVTGRSGASSIVIDSLSDVTAKTLLFGWGPAALMPKRGDAIEGGSGFRPLGITYGIVGWSRDVISIGLPGAVFYLLFLLSIMRGLYRRVSPNYLARGWSAICFGTLAGLLTLMYTYCLYDLPHIVVTFVLLFYAAVLLSPAYRNRLRPQSIPETYRFRIVPCKPKCYELPEQTQLL